MRNGGAMFLGYNISMELDRGLEIYSTFKVAVVELLLK